MIYTEAERAATALQVAMLREACAKIAAVPCRLTRDRGQKIQAIISDWEHEIKVFNTLPHLLATALDRLRDAFWNASFSYHSKQIEMDLLGRHGQDETFQIVDSSPGYHVHGGRNNGLKAYANDASDLCRVIREFLEAV